MGVGQLTIDLGAIAANWRALGAMSRAETGAVVKADGYGLGAARIAKVLAGAGARSFFVASAEEGATVRAAVGPGADIYVFSGHMQGDTQTIGSNGLFPLLNSTGQLRHHLARLPGHPFGFQLDTGMNRLGMEAAEFAGIGLSALPLKPSLIISHLACADMPGDPMNEGQLKEFKALTKGLGAPLSLAATGGILLGAAYHFDLLRPGVGLYGGLPFAGAARVVTLELPVIQTREVRQGEIVGYANGWRARKAARIATIAAGYADGLPRSLSKGTCVFADGVACPVVGRISMDLITVDVTDLRTVPDTLEILGENQSVDQLAADAGTIGYEILTSLGSRPQRRYVGG